MREILKYSCLIFLYALSNSYLVTCFAIDLKIQGFEERYIGLGLSFFGIGVLIGALSHYLIRKKFNLKILEFMAENVSDYQMPLIIEEYKEHFLLDEIFSEIFEYFNIS